MYRVIGCLWDNTLKCLGKGKQQGRIGPPSSSRVALELPWLSPVPMGAAGLKQPLSLPPRLPDTWSTRQTLGDGASDSIPDLPGSPRLRLMDDPPLSLPPPSKGCCLQGHPPACSGSLQRQGGAAGWLVGPLLAFPPSFLSAALPGTPRSPPQPPLGLAGLGCLCAQILPFSHCKLSACQPWARHCARSLSPRSSWT